MIILFGRKGCNKTCIEKKLLEAAGKQMKFYDIDTTDGRQELQKRGLFYQEVRANLPWVINEK